MGTVATEKNKPRTDSPNYIPGTGPDPRKKNEQPWANFIPPTPEEAAASAEVLAVQTAEAAVKRVADKKRTDLIRETRRQEFAARKLKAQEVALEKREKARQQKVDIVVAEIEAQIENAGAPTEDAVARLTALDPDAAEPFAKVLKAEKAKAAKAAKDDEAKAKAKAEKPKAPKEPKEK